jgi:hypothetical protein
MSQPRSATKYGDLIERPAQSAAEPEPESEPEPEPGDADPEPGAAAAVTVTRHTIAIDDQRDAHGYEHGLEWLFAVEDGVIKGYYRGHWLEGQSRSDPTPSVAWSEVPTAVKHRLREELNVDELAVDLPEHYGGGCDGE